MKTKIYTLLTIYCVIYFMTYRLWDSIFGPYFKYLTFIIITMGMFGFFMKLTNNGGIKIQRKSKVFLGWYFFIIAIYLINALFWINSEYVFKGLYSYVFYQIIFLAVFQSFDHVNILKVLKVFKNLGVIIAILACYEVFSGATLLTYETDYLGILYDGNIITRARVFAGSFLILGMLLSCTTLISYYFCLVYKGISSYIICIINFFGVLMTSSRGPLIATLGGALVIWFALNPINTKRASKNLFLILSGGLLIICLVIVFQDVILNIEYINYLWQRLASIFNWSTDNSNVQRMTIWTQVIEVIKQNWIFGVGIGSTGTQVTNSYGITVTESGILRRFVELGIIGAGLYYCFILYIVKNYALGISKRETKFSPAAVGVIIAILIEDIILQVSDSIMISSIFWFCLAIVVKEYSLRCVSRS